MDLAIVFHTGSIKRGADLGLPELDRFGPDSRWLDDYRHARQAGKRLGSRILLDAYERGLHTLGYGEIRDYVLVRNRNNVPLYHIIFASKDKRGADFWEKISAKTGLGQIRMELP